MKKRMALLIVFCILIGNLMGISVVSAENNFSIYMAGDSTSASYNDTRAPLTGWAQKLGEFLPSNVTVKNHAVSGTSSKSFADSGKLDAIMSTIQPGDYLIIQFGHNDQKVEDSTRYTEPNTTYKDYLKQYIDKTRQKGATPILATSIERRRFESGKAVASLTPYAQAMRELAVQENVTLIDLNKQTLRLYNYLGEGNSKQLFLILQPGESPNYPNGITDNTHLRDYGAGEISKLFLSELAKTSLPIAQYGAGIISPVPDVIEGEDEGEGDNNLEMVSLLEEDFDQVPSEIGESVFGWNGWRAEAQYPTKTYEDSNYTVSTDPDGIEDNKVGSFNRPQGRKDDTRNSFMAKNLPNAPNSGYMSIRFKVRPENTQATYFQVRVIDGLDALKNLQFQVAFDRSTIADTKTGGKIFQFNGTTTSTPTPLKKWYEFEILLNLTDNQVTYYEAGKELGTAPLHADFIGRTASQIWLGTNRLVEAGGQFYFDDLIVKRTPALDIASSVPQDGQQDVDVYDGMNITFTNEIDPTSISNTEVLLNGSSELIESYTIDIENKNVLNITFAQSLEFDKNYQLQISKIMDIYKQTIQKSVSFKTRSKQFLFYEPDFYLGDINITDRGLASGTLKCSIQAINELEESFNAVMIAALFKGYELVDVTTSQGVFAGNDQTTKSLEATLLIPANADDYNVKIFVWDSISLGKPYVNRFDFNYAGLSYDNTKIREQGALSVWATAQHESGNILISGKANSQAEVTALGFRPGFTLNELTIENFQSALEFIGQTKAFDGEYNFTYVLTGTNRFEEEKHTVNVLGGKSSAFKLFNNVSLDSVLHVIAASSIQGMEEILAEKNPKPIADGIILNDVLQLDLSQYFTIKDKTYVCEQLARKSFATIDAVRTVLIEAIKKRIAEEATEAQILADINNAEWDELDTLFHDNNTVLKLDWGGNISKLDKSGKTLLYKKLAHDYTFVSIRDIRSTFSQIINSLISDQDTGGGSGNGSSGGRQSTVAMSERETPVLPVNEPSKPVFSDISDAAWAKEAIEALNASGIIMGIGNDLFAPHEKVTREQFIKMLVLAFNMLDNNANIDKFQDVNRDAWYYTYVASAVEQGIIQGIDENSFGVGRHITRAEMAVMTCRVAQAVGVKLPAIAEPVEFYDAAEIPEYARSYITDIQRANLMTGVEKFKFTPNEGSTRAMAAKVIYGLLGMVSQ